jgi:glycosyltransferase involved in cell wall biosynthesis
MVNQTAHKIYCSMIFSIITVNYNDALGLERTISSVVSQDFLEIEYLIIDGGSTDASLKVIENNAHKISYWVSEPDNGIYHAMNKGIRQATGRYLMFLNSGDCLSTKNVLQECYAAILTNPNTDILYGDVNVLGISGKEGSTRWSYPAELGISFFKRYTINHQASLIRSELFKELGLYPEQYKVASDYFIFLQSMLHDKKYMHINSILVNYDATGVSASENYKNYIAEMEIIWSKIVPLWSQELVRDYEVISNLVNSRIVKFAIYFNNYLKKCLKNLCKL